jgi:3-oxoacyl-[acyl-carrier-protein] synthase II
MTEGVVITGRGVVSPAGSGVAALWSAVSDGASLVGAETLLELEGLPIAAVSARLPQAALREVTERWASTRRSDGEALLWDVIEQALNESSPDANHQPRTALLTTQLCETGFESSTVSPAYGEQLRALGGAGDDLRSRYQKAPPIPREGVGSRLYADLSRRLGAPLSVLSLQATCATGLRLVCEAARLIRLGRAERVIVAVVSRPVDALHFAAFSRALSLSRWEGAPFAASRPFDQQRSGFVLGEAAAALVLESEALVRARSAKGIARVLGWGLAMSSAHFMRPSFTHMVRVMRQALAVSGVDAERIDLVDAMAASTQLGDAEEARAIHRVFGADLERLHVSAEKATLGYSVQAAALVELIACTAAMQAGLAPPVPHCDRQDTDIELPLSAVARPRPIEHVLKHAFGLGGQYGALVLQGLVQSASE